MKKKVSYSFVPPLFRDGMTIFFGGFLAVGTPPNIIRAILESGAKDLTIAGNDTAFVDKGVGLLVVEKRVKRIITSHIGTNPETGRQMIAGETQVELVPQGTLIERIRCGGAGLGGVLTPTGIGTIVEEGKQKIRLNGIDYLLETALRADISIVHARRSDEMGNLEYELAMRNFNPIVATAADLVIAEVDEIVPIGAIHPDHVMTPAALVDHVLLTTEC